MEGEFIETPYQAFEVVPRVMPFDSLVTPKVTRAPPKMDSLKDAKAVVEEGGCIIWGQLSDFPFKFDKIGLGFTSKGQKMKRHKRAGRPPFCINKNRVHAIEDDDGDFDINNWIFPTPSNELNNWTAKDAMPISFRQE